MADRIGVGDRRVGVTERVDVDIAQSLLVCCIVLLRHFTQTCSFLLHACGVGLLDYSSLYRIVLSHSLSHTIGSHQGDRLLN